MRKREQEKLGLLASCLAVFLLIVFYTLSVLVGTNDHGNNHRAPHSSSSPSKSDVRNSKLPTPPVKDFINRSASEYGLRREDARQALRNGALQGYSNEEVDRVFGK